MANINVKTVIKVGIGLASVAVGILEKWQAKKDLDELVTKKVAEAFAGKMGES